jgi:bile acid-coenzyme A ligase
VPIPTIFARHAAERGSTTAVTVGEDTLSFSELYEQARGLAGRLADSGVTLGDYVAIALPNSTELYVAALAAWLLGATPMPVSSALAPNELEAILEISSPAIVLRPRDEILALRGDKLRTHFDLGVVAPAWKAQTTGGSTGRPKVVVAARPAAVDPMIGGGMLIAPEDTCLITGPLYHGSPFTYTMYGLFMGAHQVVMPRFRARTFLELLASQRVTWTMAVPTMLSRALRELKADPGLVPNLANLRILWHMASPCAPWLKRAWIGILGPERIWELYGSVEGQEVAIISGTDWLMHPGSVGKPRGGGAFTILDADRRPVPRGTVGDIFVRGADPQHPNYRYLGGPAAESAGDWETVGDLGWMDEEGYLYVSDRRLDLIISGGVNVYPAEVEAAIDEHTAVASSAVIGIPDDDLGQRVHAVVQAVRDVSKEELVEFLSSRLSRAKLPRSIEIVSEPLRDDAGKLRRSAVRDRVLLRSAKADQDRPNGGHR